MNLIPHRIDRTASANLESGAVRTWVLALVALALVAAVVVGVMAAGGDDGGIETTPESSTGAAASSSSGTDEALRPLPTFTADTRSGDTLSSADITGPALISVFASWCPSCQAHAPEVAKLQGENPDLSFYYINVADDAGPAKSFIAEYKWADGPVLVDDDRSLESQFGLSGQPHSIFVNGDGEIVDILQGGGSIDELRAAADRASA